MEGHGVSAADGAAFILDWDFSQLGDEDYFAYLVEFPGSRDMSRLADAKRYDVQQRVFFTGNFAKLKTLDYPYNSARWPLMSAAMVSALEATGTFEHQKLPVTILDDTVAEAELFEAPGKPKPQYALDRFTGVQVLEHLDAFDWDRSEYVRSDIVPSMVEKIEKLALRDVSGGFPPLFRLSAYPTLLFVSAEARRALEAKNITGATFLALADYPRRG